MSDISQQVAQEVMGWHTAPIEWAYDGSTDVWHDADGTPLLTTHAWQPDIDDAQCMQVVDQMLQYGFELALSRSTDSARACFRADGKDIAAATHVQWRDAVLHCALAAQRAGRSGE